MKKRAALLVALSLAVVTVLAGCGGKDSSKSADSKDSAATFEEKKEGDTFTVGFDQDFPPMGFVGDDGEYTGFMNLESGAVDAVAMDIVVAKYQIESRSAEFKILDYEIASEQYGVGFAKGNDAVKDQVQKTLEEMAADGTLAKISTKWFGEDITTIGK